MNAVILNLLSECVPFQRYEIGNKNKYFILNMLLKCKSLTFQIQLKEISASIAIGFDEMRKIRINY